MTTGDMFAVFRQMQKGPWTNDPNHPTYLNHWNTARPSAEVPRQVYSGVARGPGPFGPKQMVNVVVTDQNTYVDTPSIERVGPVARGAGLLLDLGGLSAPQHAPIAQTSINPANRPQRMVIQAPSLPPIRVNTGVYRGRPSDLSPLGQVKNMWAWARG